MKSRIEFRARGLLGCGISDVLPDTLMREMARDYANMLGGDLTGRDTEREAAEG